MTSARVKIPPSVNKAGGLASTDRLTGHRERLAEREKKTEERLAAIEVAMEGLPLKPGAKADVRKMSSLFEQTHRAISRQTSGRKATTTTMEEELSTLAKGLNKVAKHIDGMHRETLFSWARAGGTQDAAANVAALLLVIREAGEWAQLSLDSVKRAKRVGGRGRTRDRMAKAMRETAAFVYENLTSRKANIAYDAIASQELATEFVAFLDRVFEIYGVQASARSRARKRKPMAIN